VGLLAILEIGVTAALSAAATNWLILRRATPRREAEGVWGERFSPRIGGLRGVAPPNQQGQHDETDDDAGHRIYLNPWAIGDQDDEVPVGLVEEYGDEP
jgi:hypothetical protein